MFWGFCVFFWRTNRNFPNIRLQKRKTSWHNFCRFVVRFYISKHLKKFSGGFDLGHSVLKVGLCLTLDTTNSNAAIVSVVFYQKYNSHAGSARNSSNQVKKIDLYVYIPVYLRMRKMNGKKGAKKVHSQIAFFRPKKNIDIIKLWLYLWILSQRISCEVVCFVPEFLPSCSPVAFSFCAQGFRVLIWFFSITLVWRSERRGRIELFPSPFFFIRIFHSYFWAIRF